MIDGYMDEEIWSTAIPITHFLQEEPMNLENPSEKTEVRFLYNDNKLFIFDTPRKCVSQRGCTGTPGTPERLTITNRLSVLNK